MELGFAAVASQIRARSLDLSGNRCFMNISGGPWVPGISPSPMMWQERQLPFFRSTVNFLPCATVSADAPAWVTLTDTIETNIATTSEITVNAIFLIVLVFDLQITIKFD